MSIGKKIKELRLKNEKTQLDLSKILDVTYQTIYKYEKDIAVPPPESLAKLAEYFKVTVDFLLDRESNIKNRIEEYKHLDNPLMARLSNKLESMSDNELKKLDKLIDIIINEDK